ncbi:MAG: hypothetical protein ISS49_07115 [Anaerolineae bacterium]|nr:hypothetical protein [Anaerolineae bacterium]
MCEECGCGLDTGLVCPECGGRMVLINNRATCLSCGATPAPDADPPEQEEHHHHTGHAHEETKIKPDDLTKLRALLPHWIEHNEEHAASFEGWAAKARVLGQEETAQRIGEAVERMAACNQALAAALEGLKR